MEDLTEAARVQDKVTAQDVFDRGFDLGVTTERQAVLNLLTGEQMLHNQETADALWLMCRIIIQGTHRLPKQ